MKTKLRQWADSWSARTVERIALVTGWVLLIAAVVTIKLAMHELHKCWGNG